MKRHLTLLLLLLTATACATAPAGRGATDAAAVAVQAAKPDPRPFAQVLGPVAAEGATELRVLDVGQGDGVLIRGPGGKTVLVDAGTGKGGLAAVAELAKLGLARVDIAVITHPHLDHMGGFIRMFDKVAFGEFLDSGYPHTSKTFIRLLNEIEKRGIPLRKVRRGEKIDLGGGATMSVLAPEEPLFHGTRSDANANSIVLRVDVGDVCAVLAADAEAETEERIEASGDSIRCPVLKVAHHGGSHSTSDTWLAAVKPAVAVISVGARNRYGHPREDTLDRLEAVGARVYRTDRDGTVVVRTDGKRVMVIIENQQTPVAPAQPAAAVGGQS